MTNSKKNLRTFAALLLFTLFGCGTAEIDPADNAWMRDGIRPAEEKLDTCRGAEKGAMRVKLRVSPLGNVTDIDWLEYTLSKNAQACHEVVLKGLKFKPKNLTRIDLTFAYVFK